MNIKTTNYTKWIGIILFLAGILLAILSGAKQPIEGATYPNTIPTFLVGAITAITGLIIWHLMQKKIIRIELANQKDDDQDNPITLLKNVIPLMKELQTKINSLNTTQVCEEIDKILDGYILPFAEVRKNITNFFGMSIGSEILVTVAYGERMLNRVWSAASDGHLPEAMAVFPDALHALVEAGEILEKNMNK